MTARTPWFLPPKRVDVLGLLRTQVAVTVDGLAAFADWSRSGAETDADRVRAAEHDGDAARRELLEALTVVLTTPIEQEHAYALSERIDEVLDHAKDTVRLAQALDWSPDAQAAEMGAHILEAASHLRAAIDKLGTRRERPGEDVELGIKSARKVEKDLRAGLAGLPRAADGWSLVATLEVYRSYSAVAAALARVADRTWYAALRVL
jgi:uncharacterized protein Yka (UPF0111/DUF47 family)